MASEGENEEVITEEKCSRDVEKIMESVLSKDNESMIITIPPDLGQSDDQINFQQRGIVQV